MRVEDLAQRGALTLGPVECLIAGLQELHGLTQPWRVFKHRLDHREDYALLKTECSSPLLWCACAFVQSTCLCSLLRTYCCPVSIQGWVVLVEHVKKPSHCSRSWSSVWRDHPQGFALIAGSVQAILVLEGPTNGVSAGCKYQNNWSNRALLFEIVFRPFITQSIIALFPYYSCIFMRSKLTWSLWLMHVCVLQWYYCLLKCHDQ